MSELTAAVGSKDLGTKSKRKKSRPVSKISPETLVETVVFLPGNFGLNNGPMYIRETPPQRAPGIHLVVTDADASLLDSTFRPDKGKRNLAAWERAKRLHRIQLRAKVESSDNPDPRTKKLFGAGGDPAVGEKIARLQIDEFKKHIRGKDLVILWVGGGGGIGTGVARVVAEIAETENVPLITLLATPDPNDDPKKAAVCDQLRTFLRTKGRVMVFKNECVPDNIKKLTQIGVYNEINRANRPVFQNLEEVTQRQGDSSNADFRDVLTLLSLGQDMYGSTHELPPGSNLKEVDPAQEVAELMGHIYQDRDIQAQGMIVTFIGPWSKFQQDEIRKGLRQATKATPDLFNKTQSREKTRERRVSVLIAGHYAQEKSQEAVTQERTVAVPPVATLHLVPPAETERSKEPSQIMNYLSGGKDVEVSVPVSLADRWIKEIRRPKKEFNVPRLNELREEFYRRGFPRPDLKFEGELCEA